MPGEQFFDVIGKSVATIINEQKSPGGYTQVINLKDELRQGLYFVKTTIGKNQSVQKVVVQ